ncbi:MAG TPA: peroxide stress protein YaaA [Saprospirales bacterium]|mgnify:FL=1|nr:peroxide stress protein YaaA [Saprospirales bacterium]
MITLLSPAKSLDIEKDKYSDLHTEHSFPTETMQLVRILKKMSLEDLCELMHISEKLGQVNITRYTQFKKDYPDEFSAAALYAFRGDVYQGFDADTANKNNVKYAQKHIRILSGLYGVLRPMDKIQAYRLEMGTKLENNKGNNLYEFWGSKISNQLNKDLVEMKSETIINLASNEYFKAVDQKKLKAKIIDIDFREERNGQLKFVSFNAKKARGYMARFIVDHRVKTAVGLMEFNTQGYNYVGGLENGKMLFVR